MRMEQRFASGLHRYVRCVCVRERERDRDMKKTIIALGYMLERDRSRLEIWAGTASSSNGKLEKLFSRTDKELE